MRAERDAQAAPMQSSVNWSLLALVIERPSYAYEQMAPYAGFHLRRDLPERAQFANGPTHRGSFSLVVGEPTLHLGMTFPATSNAIVEEFHRAALAAGYQDRGAPGVRSGFYSASIVDPDGNIIEVRHGSS